MSRRNNTHSQSLKNFRQSHSGVSQYLGSRNRVVTVIAALVVCATLASVFVYQSARAATTYTWNQTGTASWTTAANWTPARTTPAVDDILVFDNSATTVVTGVPTQTIGQLLVSNSTNVTLQPAAGVLTLTIAGGAGIDLVVNSGTALNISGGTTNTNTLKLLLSAGATANIDGTMTFSTAQHQLDAADASAITFSSGAIFTYNPGANAGNPFTSAGTANAVVFASGSTYVFQGGANPFGLAQPASKVVFQSGNLFRQTGTGTPAFSGRTYANYELNNAAANITVTGGSSVSVGNLTITAGTLNFNMTGTPGHSIKGNVSVASGATLNFNPATPGQVAFNGVGGQSISNLGTLTTSANQTFVVVSSSSITVNNAFTLAGTMNVNSGGTLATGATFTNNGTTNINGTFRLHSSGSAAGTAFVYGAASTLIYFGTGAAQTSTNVEFPAASGPFNLSLNNSSGMTLHAARTVSGTLDLIAGNFASGGLLSLASGSQITKSDGDMTGTPQGAGTYNVVYSGFAKPSGSELAGAGLTNVTVDMNPSQFLSLNTTRTVPGTLFLTNGMILTGANTLILGAAGTVTRTNGFVVGNFRKTFNAAGTLAFEVGTIGAYSPVSVNATAGSFPANFTISATVPGMPAITGANKLGRFWTLTNTTVSNANLTFNYLPGDVVGTVANYQFVKNTGGTLTVLPPTGTPTATSATINGVTSFSDWTLAEPSAIQAETGVAVSGGNLLVTDVNGGTSDDHLSLSRNGANVRVSDSVATLTAGAGTVQIDANTVEAPLASITGNIQVNTLAGNDTLTLALAGGNFFPSGGVNYTGGADSGLPSDRLHIVGGSQGTVTYNYANLTDGDVNLSAFGTVTYTGLEGLLNVGTSADVVFNLPPAGALATLTDDGLTGNSISQLHSAGTFVSTDFVEPTGTVTLNRGSAGDMCAVNGLADFTAGLTIGNSGNPFNLVAFDDALPLAAGKNLSVDASSQINIDAAAAISTSGAGAVTMTGRNLIFGSASSISVVNGNLTLNANTAGTAAGNFTGINLVSASLTTSGTGNIVLTGKGGNDAGTLHHVGIDLSTSTITSTSAAAGAGTITLNGTGGQSASTSHGVAIQVAPASISSVTGDISITGHGGPATGSFNLGVDIESNAAVSSTGAARITIDGTGGSGTSALDGVVVGSDATITSTGGDILITGHGGNGSGSNNFGVLIAGGCLVDASGGAKITIDGTGGSGTSNNSGTFISGEGTGGVVTKVTSSAGDIQITGHGGNGTAGSNKGVTVAAGGQVSATGGAMITIDGFGGSGTSFGAGSVISGASITNVIGSRVTSDSGNITINGQGGNGSSFAQIGVNIDSTGSVVATGSANIFINGTGGIGTTDSYGFGLEAGDHTGTGVSAVNGNITITGTATDATGTDQDGVRFEDSVGSQLVMVTTTGTGSLTVTGTAGNNDATSAGINIVDDTAISLSGAANSFIADTMDIGSSAVSVNAGANALTLRQKTNGLAIDLGGADTASQLGLTDAELDLITAGTLNFGNTASGAVTVSAPISRAAATNLNLASGVNIDIVGGSLASAGGNVALVPGTNVFPSNSGVDVNAGAAATVNLTSGRDLRIVVNSTTVDSGYTQLNVAGLINLNNATLAFSGSHTPVLSQQFTIVNNDGADAISGIFNTLSEGTVIPSFLGSGLGAKISYVGGDGNDAVLTVVGQPTAGNGHVSGQILDSNGLPIEGAGLRLTGTQNRLTVTDAFGNYYFDEVETNGFYTVTPSRANFVFGPAQRSFSQLGNSTSAVFTAWPTGEAHNPLDTTEYFVRQQYVDFLGREPDEAGLNFWVNNIERCGNDIRCRTAKRTDTSAAFFLSIEFRETGYLVYRTYRAAYGDLAGTPVPLRLGEFKPDKEKIGNGVVVNQTGWAALLEANKQAYLEEFVQRSRFATAYSVALTPDEFVDKLFQNAGVIPANGDRQAAVDEFAAASTTADAGARGRALRRVAENPSLAQQEFNRAFVLMQYFGYLRRDANSGPDTNFGGYNFWLDKLNTFNGDFREAEMVKAFLVSGEYRGRFPR